MEVSRVLDILKTVGKRFIPDSHFGEKTGPNFCFQKSDLLHSDAVWEGVDYPFILQLKDCKRTEHKSCIKKASDKRHMLFQINLIGVEIQF